MSTTTTTPQMMRAVRCAGAGDGVKLTEARRPPGGDVRVRIVAAGICGTDLHAAYGDQPPSIIMGHELSGLLDDGTPVAIEPALPCGTCGECRRGLYHLCRGGPSASPADIYLGFSRIDGGMADELAVPARCLVPLPDGLAVADACLVEPLAVALHALHIGGVAWGSGLRVAVVGGGTLGLCVTAAAVAYDSEVGLVARYDHQATAGIALGAVAPEGEYDVVVDAAGGSAAADAVGLVRPGGTLVFLAAYYGPVPVSGIQLLVKEVRTVTSLGTATHDGRRDVDRAAALLAARPEIAARLITHRLPLGRAPEGFELARNRSSGAIKVVLEPQGG